MHIYILCFFLCIASASHAEIFKCVKPNAQVLFKDTPCKANDYQQRFNYVEQPITKQDVRVMQKQYVRHKDAVIKARKKSQREQQRAKKQQELEQKRRLRLAARCERVKQQIEQVNQRQRHGYTVKQGLLLDRKLAEYNLKRARYCNTLSHLDLG